MKQSARIKNMDQTLKNTLGICALLAFCFGAAIASGYHLEYEYGYRYSAVGALASVVFLLLLARGFPRVSSVVLLIYVGTTALLFAGRLAVWCAFLSDSRFDIGKQSCRGA
ncbi:hypothetical protein DYG39_000769 [Neisseria gonorrhoeae]